MRHPVLTLMVILLSPLIRAADLTPAIDRHGDPLPPGAVARLGTVRWRQDGSAATKLFAVVAEGRQIVSVGSDGGVFRWDANTGKVLTQFNLQGSGRLAEPTTPVVLARDGSHLAVSGGAQRNLRVLRLQDGEERWKLEAPAKGALYWPLTFSPDGQSLAVRTPDGTVSLRAVDTGKETGLLKSDSRSVPFAALAFAPDGKTVASLGTDGVARLWDARSGKLLSQLGQALDPAIRASRTFPGFGVTWAPDGRALVVVALGKSEAGHIGPTIHVWRREDGTELGQAQGDESRDGPLVVAPDFRTLAWTGRDGVVQLFDLPTLKPRTRLGQPVARRLLDAPRLWMAPDGRSLVILMQNLSQRVLSLWNLDNGTERWRQSVMYIDQTAFLPDGKTLAVIRAYGTHNEVTLLEAATGKEQRGPAGHRQTITALEWAGDGKMVTTAAWDGLRCWDASTGEELHRAEMSGPSLWTISADGRIAAARKPGIAAGKPDVALLWDLPTGRPPREVELPKPGIVVLAVSPDGRLLAVRGKDRVLRLIDAATGKTLRTLPEPVPLLGPQPSPLENQPRNGDGGLSFSPDGDRLATVWHFYQRGEKIVIPSYRIFLLEVATGRLLSQIQSPPNETLRDLCFSPDGVSLATANRPADQGPRPPPGAMPVRLWETASGQERFHFAGADTTSLTFSRDGRTLAAGGAGTIWLWEADTGRELSQLKGHKGLVIGLRFAPHDRALASGGVDPAALIWDVSGRLARRPPGMVALTAERLEMLWADLADSADRAFPAILALSAFPGPTLNLLQQRLRPAVGPGTEELRRLVADLNSDSFMVRQKAEIELLKLGELAIPSLLQLQAGQLSLDLRQRVERLLSQMQASQRLASTVLQQLRGLEVLERIGTPEASKQILALSKGAAGARLTQAAQRAQQRLSRE